MTERFSRAPVISAFDLLYSEYDKSLERLNSRLNSNDSHFKSEQIVACLLRDILSQDSYRSMMFHSQIALNQLVLLERGILHTVNSYSCVTGPVVTLLFTIRSGRLH